jgi:hypothetical protein
LYPHRPIPISSPAYAGIHITVEVFITEIFVVVLLLVLLLLIPEGYRDLWVGN